MVGRTSSHQSLPSCINNINNQFAGLLVVIHTHSTCTMPHLQAYFVSVMYPLCRVYAYYEDSRTHSFVVFSSLKIPKGATLLSAPTFILRT